MRIAMFTNNYKPFIAGVPISIERLSKGLRALGHEVVIFAPDYGICEEEENVVRYKTLYQKDHSGLMVGNCFDSKIEKTFLRRGFDVIHVHHPMISGYAALYLGKKYGIPVAYTYHTRYEEYLHYFKLYSSMERHERSENLACYLKRVLVPRYMTLFANSCDLVFAPTEMMRDCLAQYGTETRIEILPTGLEDSSFMEQEEAVKEIRSRYQGEKKYLFCTVSRLEKEKNLEFLMEGAARLKECMGDCFRIMVIGEGSQRGRLRDLAVNLGIEDNIIFIGKVPNDQVRNYQFASDLFLFASKSETQGIVLLEAMAAGSPVVAVRASGVVDVVQNGHNGYMTSEDAGEWARAVLTAVSSRSHHRNLKTNAVRTASGYHSIRIASAAEQYYLQMTEEYKNHKMVEALLQPLVHLNVKRMFQMTRRETNA